jgi:hypothetical protein
MEPKELTVRGQRVVVRVKGSIETVSHDLTCEWCRKTLRPKYHTDLKRVSKRRRYREAQGWIETDVFVSIVERRTFTGSFGSYGDNIFCGLTCARNWAIATVQNIDAGNAILKSTKTGKAITYSKGAPL